MATKIKQVRESLIKIGNRAHEKYAESEDLKAGLLAVKAMGEATRTSVAQVHYKRLTGTPTKIDFLEE
jgi:ribosomal protein L25 (general stress protein Ctc)